MPSQEFKLIDVSDGAHSNGTVIDTTSGPALPADSDWSVGLNRMQGGPADGIDLITLNNGHLSLSVLASRGMGIWKAQCGSLPLKWDSPVEIPVHPSQVDQSRRGGIGWLDGFNELICRCGLGWHGAPGTDTQRDTDGNITSEQFLPLHGRIANLAAHQVTLEVDDSGTLRLTGVVDETSMFGERLRLTSVLSTRIGSSGFAIADTVTNLGGGPAEVEMLYHCNFGTPMLGEGSTLHTAARRVAPRDPRAAEDITEWSRFSGPTPGYAEQVYFAEPVSDASGHGLAVLRAPDGAAAVGLRFQTSTLPWLTLWKNTQASADGYCCGLEPSSSLPNNRQFEREQGRVLSLAPQASVQFQLSFEVAESESQARALIEEAEQLQQTAERHLESGPTSDLSPT